MQYSHIACSKHKRELKPRVGLELTRKIARYDLQIKSWNHRGQRHEDKNEIQWNLIIRVTHGTCRDDLITGGYLHCGILFGTEPR